MVLAIVLWNPNHHRSVMFPPVHVCVKVITYEQGIRFLTDFINGDTYYATDPSRNGLHNLHRAQCQLAYLKKMEENECTMKRIVCDAVKECQLN